MAMDLGIQPNILFLVKRTVGGTPIATNTNFMNFDTHGDYKVSSLMQENYYIDLGIITDIRCDNVIGTVNFNIPFTKNTSNYVWAVGSKITRITISGIIPEGKYISGTTNITDFSLGVGSGNPLYGNPTKDQSNVSVFLFKMNYSVSAQSLTTNPTGATLNLEPCACYFYYPGLKSVIDSSDYLMKYAIVGYNYNYINGTKHLQYNISLELSYNDTVLYKPLGLGVLYE
jgi:hypothetical protein